MAKPSPETRYLRIGQSSEKFFIFSTPPLESDETLDSPEKGISALNRAPLTSEQRESAGFSDEDETEVFIYGRLQFGMHDGEGIESRVTSVTNYVDAKCQTLGNAALNPVFVDMEQFVGQKTPAGKSK